MVPGPSSIGIHIRCAPVSDTSSHQARNPAVNVLAERITANHGDEGIEYEADGHQDFAQCEPDCGHLSA